jgi:hypothetical protein
MGGVHQLTMAERRQQAWLRLPMSGMRLQQLEAVAPGWLVHRNTDGMVDACLINLGGTPGGAQLLFHTACAQPARCHEQQP